MRKASLLLVISMTVSAESHAANYITCTNERGHDTYCAVTQFDLQVAAPVQRELLIGYRFACLGDDVNIGILDGGTKAFYEFSQSKDWLTLPAVTGYGPFKLHDPDTGWTEGAYFVPGCSLDVKIQYSDLSTPEKNRLGELVRSATQANAVVKSVEPLLSNVAIFKTIIAQLDIPTIVSLMREKYDSTKLLKDSFDRERNTVASNALSLVLDDLKLSICVNPVLAEKNKDICGESGQSPVEKKDIVDRATEALTQIETAVEEIKRASATAASDTLVKIAMLLGYSSEETKKKTLDELCPVLQNLGVENSICKKDNP